MYKMPVNDISRLQIRLQRLFVAGLRRSGMISGIVCLTTGIDQQQRRAAQKRAMMRAADQFCFLHTRLSVISISV